MRPQKQLNFRSPSKIGVLEDPQRAMQVHFSERSDGEAQVTDGEDESDGKKVGQAEVNIIKNRKR